MPPKRACDTCISRKVKCSGSWPCDTCRDATKQVPCTYLKPPRRRGPKVRRVVRQGRELFRPPIRSGLQDEDLENGGDSQPCDTLHTDSSDIGLPTRISKAVLEPIVRLYRQHSYSVWPIINAGSLLKELDDIIPENTENTIESIDCLVTALCAATMAQLQLAPVKDGSWTVDSKMMAQTCLRIRAQCYSNKTNLDLSGILVSFFLHVYHAKVNQRTSAMMYIQEAISGAKLLGLDKAGVKAGDRKIGQDHDIIANKGLVFPLLWVSER